MNAQTCITGQGYSLVMRDSTGTTKTLFGVSSFTGDGALAIDAELRGPSLAAFDDAGNTYIRDEGNNRIRKIDSTGVISTVNANISRINLWSGVATGTPLNGAGNSHSFVFSTVAGACAVGCSANGADPIFFDAVGVSLLSNIRMGDAYSTRIMYDGNEKYLWSLGRDFAGAGTPTPWRTILKKADAAGTLTDLSQSAGLLTLDTVEGNNAMIVDGFVVSSVQAGNGAYIDAVGGVVWRQGGAVSTGVYTADFNDVTPTWVLQQGISSRGAMSVKRDTNTVYFFGDPWNATESTKLYKKAYASDGSGAAVLVKDFVGMIPFDGFNTFLRVDPHRPNTVIFRVGNQLYSYTDPTGIP